MHIIVTKKCYILKKIFYFGWGDLYFSYSISHVRLYEQILPIDKRMKNRTTCKKKKKSKEWSKFKDELAEKELMDDSKSSPKCSETVFCSHFFQSIIWSRRSASASPPSTCSVLFWCVLLFGISNIPFFLTRSAAFRIIAVITLKSNQKSHRLGTFAVHRLNGSRIRVKKCIVCTRWNRSGWFSGLPIFVHADA